MRHRSRRRRARSAVGPIAVAASRAAARLTSSRATSAPAAANARAVAAPMAPAAPVTAAIWPASGNPLPNPPPLAGDGRWGRAWPVRAANIRSRTCRLRKSTRSGRSLRRRRRLRSRLRRCRRRSRRRAWRGRDRTARGRAPGRRGAGDRVRVCRRLHAHCGARNIFGSGWQMSAPPRARCAAKSSSAAALAPATRAASSWCGLCGPALSRRFRQGAPDLCLSRKRKFARRCRGIRR